MTDDSSYIFDSPEDVIRTPHYPSDRFSDITLLYESPNGPIRLHTASRYGRRYILKSLSSSAEPLMESVPSGHGVPDCADLHRLSLRKEFEIGIGLDHPNIRRTIGFEHVEGIGETIILEYVDGISLDEAIRTGRVKRENVREICRGIAAGLEYLHSKQIIHRDLKPSNIMLTHGGNVVKLIDFSLADGGEYSMVKIPGGTRGWMAPEQQRSGAVATVEADIYSFGRIVADMAKAAGGDAPLEDLAARCCQPDPSRRPHSVRQLALDTLPAPRNSSWLSSPWLTLALLASLTLLVCVSH